MKPRCVGEIWSFFEVYNIYFNTEFSDFGKNLTRQINVDILLRYASLHKIPVICNVR